MRTTVTVDPDVEQLLRTAMRESGQSFKETLNEAIRRGLAEVAVGAPQPRFEVKPSPLGMRAGIDPIRIGELGDELDVQAFLDLSRSLTRNAGSR
ncbi:MAG: antitoxin [Planctomycetia bacterium]